MSGAKATRVEGSIPSLPALFTKASIHTEEVRATAPAMLAVARTSPPDYPMMTDDSDNTLPDEDPDEKSPDEVDEGQTRQDREPIPFLDFLEKFPPNTPQEVTGYYKDTKFAGHARYVKLTPQLRLYCDNNDCNGYRRFDGEWGNQHFIAGDEGPARDFLVYRCRDCGLREKTYCILSGPCGEEGSGIVVKVGEFPELHIDLPSSLPKLLGPDYNIFIKGLKCEKQGLGIGAFSYYRRVVENQKGRFFHQIAKVAERLRSEAQVIEGLRKAASEDQFSRAIDDAKDHIPPSLLIDGHNPMKMLHKALSVGLHASNDETCLATAHSIRIVLQDLSRRIRETLREESELKSALSTLQQFNEEG